MNKKILALFASISLLALAGCSRIGPGHVGIVINQAGSDKGVLSTPVQTGWVFYNPFSESVVEYPTHVQTVKWTASKDEGRKWRGGGQQNQICIDHPNHYSHQRAGEPA